MDCQICGAGGFKHLGSHVAKAHKMTAREYKQMFGLPLKRGLVTPELKQKLQEAFEDNKDVALANLTHGDKYQFKKGEPKRGETSPVAVEEATERIKEVNAKRWGTR